MSTKKSNEQRIADHLNDLLKKAQPVKLSEDGQRVYDGDATRCAELRDAASKLAQANRRAADMAEIVNAAKERRPADLYAPAYDAVEANNVGYIRWAHTRRLHVAVQDQVVAMIDRSNQAAQEEYERYRLACEQGVAVPPTA